MPLHIKLPEFARETRLRAAIAGITLCAALGIGYVMQYGGTAPAQPPVTGPVELTAISPTSSVGARPAPRPTAPQPTPVALDEPALPPQDVPVTSNCPVSLDLAPGAGALIAATLTAPCHAAERVTFHHQGMMFTDRMPDDGPLTVTLPALSQTALVMTSFASGATATAVAAVPTLEFYDRIVVQWTGTTGLGLHAREFGSDYFATGHIHAKARGDLADAARGIGGFMQTLGRPDMPDAQQAQVYSFPIGAATRSGDIHLTVEAEITPANCNRQIEAQTLQLRTDHILRTRSVTLDMPECGGTGDFLVLKNLVEDLTIAAK
ncbi:translocase [Sagittula sp. SSi028]|uniref:translocase n=1 Tax=Sagittula sp. SSi028 TaxID=3400636 RepID=UPI003AF5C693